MFKQKELQPKELNKKLFSKKVFILILFSLFLIGCRTTPVLEITDAPIETSSGKKPSLSNITKQITSAGILLGWQMKKVKPGHIVATLYLRDHMARINIYYSRTNYSITYKDSSKLNYDGTNIHSNYNGWVQRLDNAIRTNVYNDNP